MDFLTASQFAKKWGITRRLVYILCKEGRSSGAVLWDGRWVMPKDTIKPEDKRCKKCSIQK